MNRKLDKTRAWTVRKSSFHYRIYKWWMDNFITDKNPYALRVVDYTYDEHGWRKDAIYKAKRAENFCHYFRVVAVYAPLMALVLAASVLALVAGAAFVVFVFPVVELGWPFAITLWVSAILAAVFGPGAKDAIEDWWDERKRRKREAKRDKPEQPGLFRTMMETKTGTKICPFIEFEDETKVSTETT